MTGIALCRTIVGGLHHDVASCEDGRHVVDLHLQILLLRLRGVRRAARCLNEGVSQVLAHKNAVQ